jgi:hypothetical protein
MDAVEPDSGPLSARRRAAGGGVSALTAGFGAGSAAWGLAFGHGVAYYDSKIDGICKRYVRPGGSTVAFGAVLVFGVDIPG